MIWKRFPDFVNIENWRLVVVLHEGEPEKHGVKYLKEIWKVRKKLAKKCLEIVSKSSLKINSKMMVLQLKILFHVCKKIPVKNIFLFTKEVIVKYIRSLEKNKTISFKVMQMFFSFII